MFERNCFKDLQSVLFIVRRQGHPTMYRMFLPIRPCEQCRYLEQARCQTGKHLEMMRYQQRETEQQTKSVSKSCQIKKGSLERSDYFKGDTVTITLPDYFCKEKKSGKWGLDEIDCHCSHKGQCTSGKENLEEKTF